MNDSYTTSYLCEKIDSLRAQLAEEKADRDVAESRKSEAFRALRDRAEKAEAALAQAQAEAACDACGGSGKPVSGAPCMCGGTGQAQSAVIYLREQLVQAQAEAGAAIALLQRWSDCYPAMDGEFGILPETRKLLAATSTSGRDLLESHKHALAACRLFVHWYRNHTDHLDVRTSDNVFVEARAALREEDSE